MTDWLITLYNQAFLPVLGNKPEGLGLHYRVHGPSTLSHGQRA